MADGEETVQSVEELTKQLERVTHEKQFVLNWLTDLLDTMDEELDLPTRAKIIGGCGRGCYRRHTFKHELAAAAEGSLPKLIEAYKKNYECWQADDGVHIRYGVVSRGCYCPAAIGRPTKPGDLHCECTAATHRTIFEQALGRPFRANILEAVRRGDKTCHILINEAEPTVK